MNAIQIRSFRKLVEPWKNDYKCNREVEKDTSNCRITRRSTRRHRLADQCNFPITLGRAGRVVGSAVDTTLVVLNQVFGIASAAENVTQRQHNWVSLQGLTPLTSCFSFIFRGLSLSPSVGIKTKSKGP